MKKLLCFVISVVLVFASIASVAVFAADKDVIYQNDFTKLPTNIVSENSESVKHVAGSSLNMHIPAENTAWSEYIPLSNSQIKGDITVSMYVRADWDGNAGGKWDNGMLIQFVQNAGGTPITQFGIWPNNASLHYNDGADHETEYIFTPEKWCRIDLCIDRTNEKCLLYYDCTLVAEYAIARADLGYIQGIRLNRISGQERENDYYIDNVLVRQGIFAPATNDIYASGVVADILSADTTVVYQTFDAMPTGTSGATTFRQIANVGVDSKYIEILGEPSAALNTYIPFSDTAITGNTTVSFALKTSVKDMKHSGMKIMLTAADGKAVGGFAVGSDNYMQYIRNGEAVTVRDSGGRKVMVKGNTWGTVSLLVNSEKGSVTLFYNGTRIRSYAIDADNAGFSGITLTKLGEGTSDISVGIDDIEVVRGLYAPTSAKELSVSDAIMDIDADYGADEGENNNGSNSADGDNNGTENAEVPSETEETPTEEEKKGCGSAIDANACMLLAICVILAGGMAVLKKNR